MFVSQYKIVSSLSHFVFSIFSAEQSERAPTPPPPPQEDQHPELQKYLNREFWESRQINEKNEQNISASPSAPVTAPIQNKEVKYKTKENGIVDNNLEEFMTNLKSQVEIFINRMKSNSSRGR